MLATLLGPLPRPDLPDDATREAILDAVLEAQLAAGLQPLTDGGWPIDGDEPVASWRAAADRSGALVKVVLEGPFTAGRAIGDSVERWRSTIAALADAGCPMVEVAEPGAVPIGTDEPARARFRDLHDRLIDGFAEVPGLHLSLAITGGSADAAGAETILGPRYASLAVDLIAGPDNWRLVRALPTERGVVCGALSAAEGSDDGPETLLWAAGYAASSGDRGPTRVGLATASSLAHLTWAAAAAKMTRLGEAVRIAGLPPDERRAAIDPRAVDSRSAALGWYDPKPRRRVD